MGALREARCGIQAFVSAHSSRGLKQALPPTGPPTLGGALSASPVSGALKLGHTPTPSII